MPQMAEKAQLRAEIPRPLFGFAMNGVLPVEAAELLQLDLFGHRLLVLRRRIVPTFALSALERDDFPTCACHGYPAC